MLRGKNGKLSIWSGSIVRDASGDSLSGGYRSGLLLQRVGHLAYSFLARDAWHINHSLSRTEAKRRYITTLISTMHAYASTTSEARELVAELEFVWDQIKSNPASLSSSVSPDHLGLSSSQAKWGPQQKRSYTDLGDRGFSQQIGAEEVGKVAISGCCDRSVNPTKEKRQKMAKMISKMHARQRHRHLQLPTTLRIYPFYKGTISMYVIVSGDALRLHL